MARRESSRPRPPRSARQIVCSLSALAAGALLGAAIMWLTVPRPAAVSPPVTRLQMSVSPADELGGVAGRPTRTAFALSPDGRTLVFSGVQKNQRGALRATVRSTCCHGDSRHAKVAVAPFFSPDGQWVGYWSPGEIRKVPLGGGPSVSSSRHRRYSGRVGATTAASSLRAAPADCSKCRPRAAARAS